MEWLRGNQAGMAVANPCSRISLASSRGHGCLVHGISRDEAFENGAGGIRTPVPRRAERRIYACSSPLISSRTRRVNNPSQGQGIRSSRSAEACQPFGSSPMSSGTSPHRASGEVPSRRSGREGVLRVGRYKSCILFTWHGCSTTRHDEKSSSGRYQSAPIEREHSGRDRRSQSRGTEAGAARKMPNDGFLHSVAARG